MQHAASPSDAFSAALDPNLRPNTLGGIPGPAPFPIPGSAPGSGNVPTSPENTSNRLNDFASHILDREEPPHPLSFTGEAGLLEAVGHFDPVGQAGQHEHEHSDPSKRDREDEVDMAVRLATENVHDGGVYEHDAQHYRHDHDHEHEHGLAHPDDLGNGHGHGHELDGGDDGMTGQEMMPAYPGRRKRRKGNEKDEHGMPLDPISMKKESHREIERRRRETINDGINDLARLVPGGLEKMGKGALLRLASEYMADLAGKVERFDAELGRVEKEKQQLRDDLDQVTLRFTDEHNRSLRYEKSWREAEDRAAAAQFELSRLRAELESRGSGAGSGAGAGVGA